MGTSYATDMRSSKSAADMTAPEAAAHMAATDPAAHTPVATAATAPTSQGVGRYGNSSQRDSRDQDDCSVQLDSFHGDIPSVSELILTLIACHPPRYAIRSARVDVDCEKSSEPTGSRCAVIDAVSSQLRDSASCIQGSAAAHATSY
jgi:hypothetical protein